MTALHKEVLTDAERRQALGRRIREARLKAKLTRDQLSARAGLYGEMLRQYEQGSRGDIHPQILAKLSQVLGIDLAAEAAV